MRRRERRALLNEFQPDIIGIEEAPVPWFARATVLILSIAIVSGLAWASLAKMDVVVRARGRLVSRTPPTLLQPLERGVIHELRVGVNDTVKKGDVLAVLDPTFTAADVAAVSARLDTIEAERARLHAELNRKTFSAGAGRTDSWRFEKVLFEQRAGQYKSKLRSFDETIARLHAEILEKQQEKESLSVQLGIAKEIEDMQTELRQKGAGSKLRLLHAQDARINVARQLDAAAAAIVQKRREIAKLEADRKGFVDGWRSDIIEKLVSLERDAALAKESLKKARRSQDLMVLKAPFAGVVLDMADRSVGSVVGASEPLLSLVPRFAPLEAEVLISARDSGFISVGDSARIKLDAFPYTRYGTLEGTVKSISHDSLTSPAGGLSGRPQSLGVATPVQDSRRYFRARVELKSLRLKRVSGKARLGAGDTLSAEIETGNRRVISYLFDPLIKGLDEGMRER